MYDYTYIHALEKQNKWREAEAEWNKSEYGRFNHAPACKMIADAIQKGDEFREAQKTTVYTVIESVLGHFSYKEGYHAATSGQRLIGYVYGITEATEAVVSLNENKYDLERIVTGIKTYFPTLN